MPQFNFVNYLHSSIVLLNLPLEIFANDINDKYKNIHNLQKLTELTDNIGVFSLTKYKFYKAFYNFIKILLK